jgi:hypothetical protein
MRQKARTVPLLLLFLLGAAVFLTACGPTSLADSRTAGADAYRLDLDHMTGTDRFTMERRAGDTLAVQFETVEGSIYLEIKGPDGTTLYAGNGKDVTQFALKIPERGTYSICVNARHANGTVHIQRVTERHRRN